MGAGGGDGFAGVKTRRGYHSTVAQASVLAFVAQASVLAFVALASVLAFVAQASRLRLATARRAGALRAKAAVLGVMAQARRIARSPGPINHAVLAAPRLLPATRPS